MAIQLCNIKPFRLPSKAKANGTFSKDTYSKNSQLYGYELKEKGSTDINYQLSIISTEKKCLSLLQCHNAKARMVVLFSLQ